MAYDGIKNYTKAIECYQKAIAIDANNAIAWFNLGCAYYDVSNLQQALQSFRKCLELEPNNDDAKKWCKHIEGKL